MKKAVNYTITRAHTKHKGKSIVGLKVVFILLKNLKATLHLYMQISPKTYLLYIISKPSKYQHKKFPEIT